MPTEATAEEARPSGPGPGRQLPAPPRRHQGPRPPHRSFPLKRSGGFQRGHGSWPTPGADTGFGTATCCRRAPVSEAALWGEGGKKVPSPASRGRQRVRLPGDYKGRGLQKGAPVHGLIAEAPPGSGARREAARRAPGGRGPGCPARRRGTRRGRAGGRGTLLTVLGSDRFTWMGSLAAGVPQGTERGLAPPGAILHLGPRGPGGRPLPAGAWEGTRTPSAAQRARARPQRTFGFSAPVWGRTGPDGHTGSLSGPNRGGGHAGLGPGAPGRRPTGKAGWQAPGPAAPLGAERSFSRPACPAKPWGSWRLASV